VTRKKLGPVPLVLVLALGLLAWWLQQGERPEARPGGRTDRAAGALQDAIREKRSGVWVEGEGTIVYLLPDDREGSRHQLCLVELDFDHTIKISHNVDLAPKVPWKKGDRIGFRGRFEWNAKGGVVHWTHHDPQGREPGGWLHHDGRTYE